MCRLENEQLDEGADNKMMGRIDWNDNDQQSIAQDQLNHFAVSGL